MSGNDFEPKLGRIREPKGRTNLRTTKRILEHTAKAGTGTLRQRGHWIDWWSRRQLEERLRKNLDIAARYSEIVRYQPPVDGAVERRS